MKQNARKIAGTAGLISCCFMLAACDPQSTFPIGPQSGAAEPEKQERAATVTRESAEPRAVAATPAPAVRADLGEVIAVEAIVAEGEASGVGAAVGGVVGGLLGNQIGSGSGRKVATAVGAVGGAVAGHTIEKNRNEHVSGYRISVRMDTGEQRSFTESADTPVRAGDRVRVIDGSLQRT
jgi:outer membrane lipoprotein SlyB